MRFFGESLTPSQIRAALAQVDRAADSATDKAGEGLYPLYETLHREAAHFAPVDAFYVCLYDAEAEKLHFVYNFDADILDDPLTIPLGEGPTSYVVRNNRPFILRGDEERAVHSSGISFGDTQRVSLSAVHVPMRSSSGTEQGDRVIGVLSAQSYRSGVYGDEYTEILQWLADQAAAAIERGREQEAWRARQAEWERRLDEQRRQTEALSESSVRALFTLGREIEVLRPLLPADNAALIEAVERLRRSCHLQQTTLHQQRVAPLLPALPQPPPLVRTNTPRETPPPAAREPELTEREQETLRLLSSGASNWEIADALGVSIHTIRFHLKNLYAKLGVRDRAHCIRKAVGMFMNE